MERREFLTVAGAVAGAYRTRNAEVERRNRVSTPQFRVPRSVGPRTLPVPGGVQPPPRAGPGGVGDAAARLPDRDALDQLRVSDRLQSRPERAADRPGAAGGRRARGRVP